MISTVSVKAHFMFYAILSQNVEQAKRRLVIFGEVGALSKMQVHNGSVMSLSPARTCCRQTASSWAGSQRPPPPPRKHKLPARFPRTIPLILE